MVAHYKCRCEYFKNKIVSSGSVIFDLQNSGLKKKYIGFINWKITLRKEIFLEYRFFFVCFKFRGNSTLRTTLCQNKNFEKKKHFLP